MREEGNEIGKTDAHKGIIPRYTGNKLLRKPTRTKVEGGDKGGEWRKCLDFTKGG